ncbi:MAG: NAD(P)-binding domain-containing protein [Nocardioidaceae bacterium]
MEHPLVIVGAGPSGLAAAAQAHERGLPTVVLEAGATSAAVVLEWSHVRLFSPWSEVVDPAARSLLETTGWEVPAPADYPTGADWSSRYLQPLAAALAATGQVEIRHQHRVTGITRRGRDLMVDAGRETEPFVVHLQTPAGPDRLLAGAVIDASGTWTTPGTLGGDGLPALGEAEHAAQISYRIPDLRDPAVLARYAGRHVAVAGTGASAQNTLVELARVAEAHPGTRITWLVRRAATGMAFGGGDNDQLVARGELGAHARAAVETGPVRTVTSFRTSAVSHDTTGRLRLEALGGQHVDGVDEIVVVTGFRPDLTMLSEIRIDLDPTLQAPRALAPLIDPNVHSCGTVYPHGAAELAQPEPGFFLAGMKSYGRAPSFLALTGFEQTRSIVAAIAGDHEAAARVELTLPETGVCGGAGLFDEGAGASDGGSGCCGPAAGAAEPLTIGGSTT